MSASLAEALYPRLPIFLQNAACWYYGKREARIRLGPAFEKHLAGLLASEWWSPAEIEAYQNEKLRELICHCYESVPFYRRRMQERKVAPDDIRTVGDLPKLPVLTKEEVRHNMDALLSEKAKKKDLILRHTSGTTGKSLHFYSSKESIAWQWAVWWRHRRRFGLDLSHWHVNFTGKPAVPPNQSAPPFWRWNRPLRQALINMHHLTPQKIEPIMRFLDGHHFEFYSGYPSIIHAMVLAAKEARLKLGAPPRVIVGGAENFLEYQKRDCQEFTGAILTDQYGLSEGCANASQCVALAYHEDFEFGVMERVEECREGGMRKARLLCTGFANSDFPFVRYDVGDAVLWDQDDPPCACGRRSRVLHKILGRADDYVVTPEGARIMRFDYVFKDMRNVKESQIVQEKLGEIRVRIVRRPEYAMADEHIIREEIRKWISPQLDPRFEYVDAIEREPSGKFQAVKSYLPREQVTAPTR